MRLRLVAALVILACSAYTVSSALAANQTIIHIHQRDLVYYNDTVDLRGITGWTENLSWWASNHDPTLDDPDHIITVKKFEAFNITKDLEPGMWYQWYAKNERDPTPVFYLVARQRPVEVAPAPTPTPVTLAAPVMRSRLRPSLAVICCVVTFAPVQ